MASLPFHNFIFFGGLFLIPLITCQQTFQNTIFDLPSQLGGEPVGVAAQAQGAPLFVQTPDVKPPTAPSLPAAPSLPQAGAAQTPLPAFTLPTLAPFTFPSHPTVAPFTFPTHPTIAPFTFPTHPPLVFSTPPPIVPPSPYAFVPQAPQPGLQATGFQQPATAYQQYNGYPQQQQYYNQQQPQQQYYNNYYNNYNQVQQPYQQQVPQVQQQVQQPVPQPQPAQNLPQVQSFESQSQVVQPVDNHQPVQQVHQSVQPVQPVNPQAQIVRPQTRSVNTVQTQVIDTESTSKKATEFNKANSEFQPKAAKVEKAALDAEVDSNLDRHIWFSPDYDVKECRKNLRGMGVKFQKKFPSYLQKGGKDRELAELVEQRLLECDRKSSASHWDKVDSLLQKINLTKSEEGECRAGLIQERISCVNLLKYACQFVDSSYHFKLVPARITIQEARQAESGAEKCRQVVRIVKQRLESGAVTL